MLVLVVAYIDRLNTIVRRLGWAVRVVARNAAENWEAIMIVDRAWVERNIGFDPVKTAAPAATYAYKPAAKSNPSLDDLQRDIIDFDFEGPEGAAFLAFTTDRAQSVHGHTMAKRARAADRIQVSRKREGRPAARRRPRRHLDDGRRPRA